METKQGTAMKTLTSTGCNSKSRSSRQNPPETLDFTFAVTVERDRDFIVQFLDGRIDAPLVLSRSHLMVVEHSFYVILQP